MTVASKGQRRKAVVHKKREIYAYAELWHASRCVLDAGCREPRASVWQYLSSTVLTAFAFEAYLNHVGERILPAWNSVERKPWQEKLKLIRQVLNVGLTAGKEQRALQTIRQLFKLRDAMAHGRSDTIETEVLRDVDDKFDDFLGETPSSAWESLIRTDSFARRAREDVETVLAAIHAARPEPKESLFASGLSSHKATLAAGH